MRSPRKLSKLERLIAGGLAGVWLSGGCLALDRSLRNSHWLFLIFAVIAIFYGFAWLQVFLRARTITFPELIAPWRANQRHLRRASKNTR